MSEVIAEADTVVDSIRMSVAVVTLLCSPLSEVERFESRQLFKR